MTATLERRMARHNREGRGLDQLGNLWRISYQPDWFRLLKLSLPVPGGRRSSRTLCRNPARTADAEPGRSVRTRITAADGSVDVAVSIEDRDQVVDHVIIGIRRKRGRKTELLKFAVHGGLPKRRI
ncbi:hypothetical protein [Candidatus Palauibacter sp.]|uniref:hypothetical protein n=1 Tax=Candidatus Palauibacter sp. TaxID=3101350 RepID=UPI003B01AC60